MSGHGHVVPRPDGVKARCGGPALCSACAREKAQLGTPAVKPCVFCEIVAGRSPATVCHETVNSLFIVPIDPVTAGHLLAIPKTHVADVAEYPELSGVVLADAARWGQANGESFNLITSCGREATQTVFHLHWHYVPRREGDGLALPWTGQ